MAIDPHADRAQVVLWLLIAAAFVVSLDSRVITPVLPAIAEDLGTTTGGAGLIVTAYLLPYGLLQLVYGPLADRVGRVPVVAVALGGFTLFSMVSAFAPALDALVVCRFFTGFVAAAVIPLTLTFIGDTVEYSRRQHALGAVIVASSLGQVLSSAIGGLLAQGISWRAIFAIDGAIALVITVLLFREPLARRRATGARRSSRAAFAIVLRDRRHILFYLLIFVEGSFTIGAFAFLGAMLRERDGFSYAAIGLMVSLFGAASIAGGRVLGRLVRRLGEQRMIGFGGAGVVATWLLAVVQPAVPFFVIAMLVGGLAFILLHTTLQTRATEIAPRARATGISLFAFSLFLGSSVGAFVVAQAIDAVGYTATFLGVAALCAVFAGVATLAIVPWSQPERGPAAPALAPDGGAP